MGHCMGKTWNTLQRIRKINWKKKEIVGVEQVGRGKNRARWLLKVGRAVTKTE